MVGLYNRYESGFHIFTYKNGAKNWKSYTDLKIFKVKFRNVVASGRQNGYVVVAKEMMILEEVK